ncbi:MAG: polymer-forming cytoskeletal protein [Spirochaetia bacterium]|nr:polymer-forming cytoskeletal protein [Spirochaetia bacterium]
MAKYNSKEIDRLAAVFGRETEFRGDLRFSESLQINGRFEGTIESTGFLYISDSASVHADIKARTVIVAGEVTGDISVTDKLEMLSSARVNGNIRTPKLMIADGVVFQGMCQMLKDGSDVNIFERKDVELI